ncbi:Formin-like protein 11 [Hordeum vulgare]|uniref:Formin-like protein n=1 Tax=Hordeum vulgare subsp. vulgare TaxID=112509 RepID=A0A8I6WJ34_HORVV|nr:formin-like protein 11 isoform X1 [Hordeum vulgare subsp. vulgare]XP_044965470.1 formin-like protein 11 isoform X1 [Hordeum vulgare subsp. vulgare]KAE8783876.1 Formin-like protein 11 [Hordeum vulgare]
MRRCRGEWLPARCIISVLLFVPMACGRLLIGASDTLPPPALTPTFIKQVDDWVEHAWLQCGLDKKSLQDVRNYYNYKHVLDIIHRISDNKGPSPVIEKGASPLTPEIKQTLLICLSKQSFEVAKTLPDGYIKTLIASMRGELTPGPVPANEAVKPSPAKSTNSASSEATTKKAVPATKPVEKKDSDGMEITTVIGVSLVVIAVLGFLCVGCCMYRESQSSEDSAYDNKQLVNLTDSCKSSSVNLIDITKLGALPLQSEAGQNGHVNQSSKEGPNTDQIGYVRLSSQEGPNTEQNNHVKLSSQEGPNTGQISYVKLSSQEEPTTGENSHVKLSSQEDPSTGQNSHVKLTSPESANTDPAIYSSSAKPMAASVGSVQGSTPMPQPMMPPPTHPQVLVPQPKAPPSPTAPQALVPPPNASPVLSSGPSLPPAPKASPPPPSAPSPPTGPKAAPPPPPPSKSGGPLPPPPTLPASSKTRPPPPMKSGNKADTDADSSEPKPKLKPFFWDKVTANANKSMVWDHLKSGSFQLSEDAIETLFGYNADKKSGDAKKDLASKEAAQVIRILDPKKAQNLAISLKALSVSAEEVSCAVKEGNELPSDLIQTLIRWVPNTDEELRLRLYTGELSQLGSAEQFLKAIIDIPYIYERLDALLFMASLPEESSNVKQSFATLEVACEELKNSRLFLKLLEAVLKTGNRMNVGTFRGGAQAFKLDTLLKLSDVKGTDGKTTLLHFVVQEIIHSEGVRSARAAKEQTGGVSSVDNNDLIEDEYKQLGLQVVSSLGDELQNVRKAAILDADQLTMSVASVGHRLGKTNEFLNTSMKSLDEDSGFHHKLVRFMEQSKTDVAFLLEEEKKTRSMVKSTVDYFHGSTGKDEGLRLFVVVRDFLAMLDKVCKEVKEASKVAPKKTKTEVTLPSHTPKSFQDPRRNLFPAIQDRRADSSSSSSDEES